MSTYALGIKVSAEALHAVLLERTEEGVEVQLKTSSSQAGDADADLPFTGPEEEAPGMEEEPDDVTIQFGDEGGGGDDMFMGSEFDDLDGGGNDFGASEDAGDTWNFQAELDDLLDECAERGYEDPEIAFCSSTSEIDEVELRLPPDESSETSEGERGLPLPASRSTLLEMLEEQYEGGVEDERVGFVPMHMTGDGRQRVLALVARPGGAVLSTLSSMQEQTLSRTPRARLLDAEISLYLGLVRSVVQLPPDTPEKTILVRSGPEDTLVLFMEGNTLRQWEHLPELTSEDSAETICSRVLLLQDEYALGDVQHIMLIAEGNESVLADAFRSYFGSASLRLLRTHLPDGEDTESEAYVAATGAALRLLDEPGFESFFQSINLLPKSYTASRFRLPVGWSVPALLALLAATTLGFVYYYFVNARAISQRRSELQTLEQQLEEVDQQGLQRRIDSVQSRSVQYSEGLQVIDRLLRGSNKWSRGLATVTGRVSAIEGLSIDQWSPAGDTATALVGQSTARPRVVRLARELGGSIRSLTFTEVRDVPLYNFEVTVPLDTTKPEAVAYWRKQRKQELAAAQETTETRTADSTAAPSADTSGRNVSIADAGGSADEDLPVAASSSSASSSAEDQSSNAEGQSSESKAWTVVVASLAEEEEARQVAETYRERVDETEYTIQVRLSPTNGRYRVGIGAFATFEAARAALREMNGVVPDDAWLHRYATSSEEAVANPAKVARREAGP